jgi:CRP/FNR family cyclic AMP-dependent transcriptional regulator
MLEQLLGSGTDTLHAARGAPIFAAGEFPKIALVGTGVIRVFVTTPLGRQLTIGYARAGDLIGVAPALAHTNEWKAEAITDVTLTVLRVDQLHQAIEESPELAWEVAEHLALLATDALHAIAYEAGQPTTVRIARHLREMALRGVGGRLVAHISHQRLADAAGTVREVVSRELNALRRDGIVSTTAGSVTIVDEDRLASIASGRGY